MLSRITDFDIRPLNITNIPKQLNDFINQCAKYGITNNDSIASMKLGKWGNEAWWCTWVDGKIISICGCHEYNSYSPNTWRLMVRTATLPPYRGRAPGDFRKMKNDFNWGFIFPYQVEHAKKQGAKKLIFTTNVEGEAGSMRMNNVVAKVLEPAGLCNLIETDADIFYTKQNVWQVTNLHLH